MMLKVWQDMCPSIRVTQHSFHQPLHIFRQWPPKILSEEKAGFQRTYSKTDIENHCGILILRKLNDTLIQYICHPLVILRFV